MPSELLPSRRARRLHYCADGKENIGIILRTGKYSSQRFSAVMPGLVPGIHVFL
jgi:hypothetical protein